MEKVALSACQIKTAFSFFYVIEYKKTYLTEVYDLVFKSKKELVYKGFRTNKREGKSDLTFLTFGDPEACESLSFMPTRELDNYGQIAVGTPVSIEIEMTPGQRGNFTAVSSIKPLSK
ncbi:hypothetical protein KH263_19725 (plasmid) [Bacillus velezensis]|uniref:Uncharacterized protein n=1 Tax=Bacillus siamensis TaxID=659243 RepID=A0AAI8N2A9_9BACI|nr:MULTISPECIES: hypothetical protein [Bacillus amyloliquefaciens group]AUJ79452.1 hypothetical protein CWD84_21980 [Bacillus siamensis]QVL41480.1 hypothetical protein KH263_19725 [Bacillus velezensis]